VAFSAQRGFLATHASNQLKLWSFSRETAQGAALYSDVGGFAA
jgi:hypothetical protein